MRRSHLRRRSNRFLPMRRLRRRIGSVFVLFPEKKRKEMKCSDIDWPKLFHRVLFSMKTKISDKCADNQSEARISLAYTKTVICHWWQVFLWNGAQVSSSSNNVTYISDFLFAYCFSVVRSLTDFVIFNKLMQSWRKEEKIHSLILEQFTIWLEGMRRDD